MYADDYTRLRYMLDAAREALDFVQHKTRQDLSTDRMLNAALINTLKIIGDAAANVTSSCREQSSAIPWQQLITMRDRLRQDYAQVDLDWVWSIVTEDLPPLIRSLEQGVPRKEPVGTTLAEHPVAVNNIAIPYAQLAAFCRRHHIGKLALFGSVLRGDFSKDSDVDVLIEFEPGYPVGLLEMAGMELELSALFGRKVDLRTPGDLSRYFRQKVLDTAQVLYAY